MLAGEGLGNVTDLPPGYPAFLALSSLGSAGSFDRWVACVWILQILMSLGSCYLVYAAIRPRAPRAAVVAFLGMAVSPVLARLAGYLLSETFSTFLASLLVYELSRFESRGSDLYRSFLMGFLCVALLLTAPATLFLAFSSWCYLAWGNRRRPSNLAAMVAGSLLLMIPWQIHCYRVTGRLQPTVFTGLARSSPFGLWCRTWMSTQADMGLWWHPEQFRALPDSIFSSPKQREELTTLYSKIKLESIAFRPELTLPFQEAARERIVEHPWHYYLVLPATRGADSVVRCRLRMEQGDPAASQVLLYQFHPQWAFHSRCGHTDRGRLRRIPGLQWGSSCPVRRPDPGPPQPAVAALADFLLGRDVHHDQCGACHGGISSRSSILSGGFFHTVLRIFGQIREDFFTPDDGRGRPERPGYIVTLSFPKSTGVRLRCLGYQVELSPHH